MNVIGRDKFVFSLSPLNRSIASVGLGETWLVQMPSAAGGIFDASGNSSAPSAIPNPMTGPILAEGVSPGDTIGIRIHEVRPVGHGRQGCTLHTPEAGRLVFLDNLSVPLEPSIGCMGVSPAIGGEEIPSTDAGTLGGNMDCRDVAAGATVFFQARVPGALFSMGDVHLAMGDGEVEGQGVESAADAVISVWKASSSPSAHPWLVRNGEIMCIGADENLSMAIHIAYEAFLSLVQALFGLPREAVQARIGPAGSVRICQSCCRIKTVRICLPLSLLGTSEDAFLEEFLEEIPPCR
jgi:amidase